MSEDNLIKVILLGEAGVGKTNLCEISLGIKFNQEYSPTLSPNKYRGKICVDNKDYLYNLWDTPGQERFRSLTRLFINNSQIILIVFEINKKESFNQIDFWYNLVKEILGNDGNIIALVGNKADLYNQREVSDEEIEKKAKDLNAKFTVISAKNDYRDFKKFLDDLLKDYFYKYHPEEYKKSYTLKRNKRKNSEVIRKMCKDQ